MIGGRKSRQRDLGSRAGKPAWQDHPWLLGLGLCLGAGPGLRQVIEPNFQLWVGLLLFPLILKTDRKGAFSLRYVWLVGLCLLGFYFLEIRSLFLLALGAAMLLLYEAYQGKTGWGPLVLLVLMSPVSMYLSRVLTFSLRLKMSAVAGQVFAWMHLPVEVQGNYFRVAGEGFSVDPACLGLHSMVTGLYLLTMVISLGRSKQQVPLKSAWILGLFALGGLLLLLANQIRIIGLVWLKAPAGEWSHDLIGLLCLLMYGCLPIWLLHHWLLQQPWAVQRHRPSPQTGNSPLQSARLPVLLGSMILLSLSPLALSPSPPVPPPPQGMASVLQEEFRLLENGVYERREADQLIYLKPPVSAWKSDHSPAICWQASGYEMKQIQQLTLGNQTVYQAVFTRGEARLYTAWWYDNGTHQTHLQLDWRKRQLQGQAPYWLVNVTTTEKNSLFPLCERLLQRKLAHHLR